MKPVVGMTLCKVKTEDAEMRKVTCIICKSKGRCRCGTVPWTPQPPRIA